MYTGDKQVRGRGGSPVVVLFWPAWRRGAGRTGGLTIGSRVIRGHGNLKGAASIGKQKWFSAISTERLPDLDNQTEPSEGVVGYQPITEEAANIDWVDTTKIESLKSYFEELGELIFSEENEPNAPAEDVPLHYTRGLLGCSGNPSMMPVDFDLAVLCIVAWFRRTPEERERLMNELATSEELNRAFPYAEKEQWLAEMKAALDRIVDHGHHGAYEVLSLKQVTEVIRTWNEENRVLRGLGRSDLLGKLQQRIRFDDDSSNGLIDILLGDLQKADSVTGWELSSDPLWMSLNTLRYWSTIGREDRLDQHHLLTWMSERNFETHINR